MNTQKLLIRLISEIIHNFLIKMYRIQLLVEGFVTTWPSYTIENNLFFHLKCSKWSVSFLLAFLLNPLRRWNVNQKSQDTRKHRATALRAIFLHIFQGFNFHCNFLTVARLHKHPIFLKTKINRILLLGFVALFECNFYTGKIKDHCESREKKIWTGKKNIGLLGLYLIILELQPNWISKRVHCLRPIQALMERQHWIRSNPISANNKKRRHISTNNKKMTKSRKKLHPAESTQWIHIQLKSAKKNLSCMCVSNQCQLDHRFA